tara:strand:- start:510 stop:611 length:102 start_codon:yes stop_codon:yes gene_type:complete
VKVSLLAVEWTTFILREREREKKALLAVVVTDI